MSFKKKFFEKIQDLANKFDYNNLHYKGNQNCNTDFSEYGKPIQVYYRERFNFTLLNIE